MRMTLFSLRIVPLFTSISAYAGFQGGYNAATQGLEGR